MTFAPAVASATTQQVNVLEGNLIECTLGPSVLPRPDPNLIRYQCGSDAFNKYAYAFLAAPAGESLNGVDPEGFG